ncbi:glycosyltransferase family 2 protein [Sesbania bispinosa]|nr:glycosyltransferase family 2 protein [Sesbania bispinosa]
MGNEKDWNQMGEHIHTETVPKPFRIRVQKEKGSGGGDEESRTTATEERESTALGLEEKRSDCATTTAKGGAQLRAAWLQGKARRRCIGGWVAEMRCGD